MVFVHQDQHHPWHGLLVEVQSCLRLFGGRESLLTRLWQQVQACLNAQAWPQPLRMALHGNPNAAWWLAKSAPANSLAAFLAQTTAPGAGLDGLPVHALDVAPQTLNTWQQCGFERLGHLRTLPRDAFLRRFGQQVLGELDAGFGEHNRQAIAAVAAQEALVFDMQQELPFHSNQLEMLERHAGSLLQTLQTWLDTHQRATRLLQLHFCMPHHTETLALHSANAQAKAEHWARLLHHQLGRVELPDDVHSIRLLCDQVEARASLHGQLFAHPEDTQRNWQNTCDTLRARLGKQAVLYLGVQEDPRPECSVLLNPTPHPTRRHPSAPQHAPDLQVASLPPSTPRPLWLLHKARPLQGQPSWHTGQALQLLSGPERIEFGWWDQQPCKRDYYCAQDQHARQVWIYRDLEQANQWFIHGVFA